VNYINPSIVLAPIYLRVSESLRNLILSNAQPPTRSAFRWIGIAAEHPERMHVLEWSKCLFKWLAPHSQLGNLAVSLSSGSICLVRPTAAASFQLVSTWHAHDFEPWTVAWNYWNTNVIYSGGDDLKLKAWDIRQNCEQPIFVNKRFEAGVTSIQSHPLVEHLIAVGRFGVFPHCYETNAYSTSSATMTLFDFSTSGSLSFPSMKQMLAEARGV